jgi:hypothetical protein
MELVKYTCLGAQANYSCPVECDSCWAYLSSESPLLPALLVGESGNVHAHDLRSPVGRQNWKNP